MCVRPGVTSIDELHTLHDQPTKPLSFENHTQKKKNPRINDAGTLLSLVWHFKIFSCQIRLLLLFSDHKIMKVKQTCSYGRWMREAYHSVVLPLTKGRWKKLLFQLAKNIYRRDTEIDNLLVRNYHFVFPCDYNWTDSLCVMENNILLHGGCWKMIIVCYYYLRGYLNMYLKSETTDTFWWWIRFSDSSFLNFLFWLLTYLCEFRW